MLMNRKQFFSKLAMFGVAGLTIGRPDMSTAAPHHNTARPEKGTTRVPRSLKAGDVIGITSPSGYISADDIQPCVAVLQQWGFSVRVGNSIGKRDGTFGGTDSERAADLQAMLDDDSVHAVLCAAGGYGMVRIIDRLSLEKLQHRPKWIIGFSDITVLHSHINRQAGLATLHAKMCSGFYDNANGIDPVLLNSMTSIRSALLGEKIDYPIPVNARNRDGICSGVVVGGNLRTLETLSGTASDIDTRGRILLVEDTGEALYSMDRMFWHLERTGKLSGLAGLLVGDFKVRPDDDNDLPFSLDLVEMVMEKVGRYHYPVCFDFPVGHQSLNLALRLGARHRLAITGGAPVFQQV